MKLMRKKKTVAVLEAGVTKVEQLLGIENLYEAANTTLIGYLNNLFARKSFSSATKTML